MLKQLTALYLPTFCYHFLTQKLLGKYQKKYQIIDVGLNNQYGCHKDDPNCTAIGFVMNGIRPAEWLLESFDY